MFKDLKLVIPAALIFILALFGIYRLYQVRVAKTEESPTPSPIVAPSGFETFPPPSVTTFPPQTQPASGSDTVEVKNIGIKLEFPQEGDIITSPIKVTGTANVFEGHVAIRVKDATGKIIGQGLATACMDFDACPFEASIVFTKPNTSSGSVEVYSPSGLDGSQQYLQTISVSF